MKVTVDLPNLPKAGNDEDVPAGTIEVPGFGILTNGETIEVTDEQVGVFEVLSGRSLAGVTGLIIDGVTEHELPVTEVEDAPIFEGHIQAAVNQPEDQPVDDTDTQSPVEDEDTGANGEEEL